MILIIHTAEIKNITLLLAQSGELVRKVVLDAKYQQAEKLLPAIKKLLEPALDKLTGIGVVVGPGPFTAIRIGLATANALSFSLRIPLVGVKLNQFKTDQGLVRVITARLSDPTPRSIVKPFYGKEPNITLSKSN